MNNSVLLTNCCFLSELMSTLRWMKAAVVIELQLFTEELKNVVLILVFSFQVKYVDDDSTIFWAVGPEQSVLASRVEHCGKEIELTIPLEGALSGEVLFRLLLCY